MSLLREAVTQVDPAEAMARVTGSRDLVERVGCAAEVLAREGAVRVVVAATVAGSGAAAGARPGYRFALIEHALEPWTHDAAPPPRAVANQLVQALSVIMSAEALLTLVDLCALSPDDAVDSPAHTARSVTAAAVVQARTGSPDLAGHPGADHRRIRPCRSWNAGPATAPDASPCVTRPRHRASPAPPLHPASTWTLTLSPLRYIVVKSSNC